MKLEPVKDYSHLGSTGYMADTSVLALNPPQMNHHPLPPPTPHVDRLQHGSYDYGPLVPLFLENHRALSSPSPKPQEYQYKVIKRNTRVSQV